MRRERGACSREIVFPDLGIRRELPTDEEVSIDLPALSAGSYPFTCGMKRMRGVLDVR